MHCPRCGQQQASEEIRFCSRCGFPLGLVSEILSNGGFLPQLADLHKTKSIWTKKNGVMFSFFWFILCLFFTAFWGIMGVEELAAISAITAVFGSFILLIGSLVLLKSSKEFKPSVDKQMTTNQNINITQQPQNLYGSNAQHALPPQQSIPVSSYAPPRPGSWKETNDLVQPNTVTDETTKILTNKDTN